MKMLPLFALSAFAAAVPLTAASARMGPVGTLCQSDIAKLCAGKAHGGDVRACLEATYGQVSAACKDALDNTGGGRGMGPRR